MKCGLIGAAAILVLLAISLEHVHAELVCEASYTLDYSFDGYCYKKVEIPSNYTLASADCIEDGTRVMDISIFSIMGDDSFWYGLEENGICSTANSAGSFNGDCTGPFPYICITEPGDDVLPLYAPVPPGISCPNDYRWDPVDECCYKKVITRVTYDVARAICDEDGAIITNTWSSSIMGGGSFWFGDKEDERCTIVYRAGGAFVDCDQKYPYICIIKPDDDVDPPDPPTYTMASLCKDPRDSTFDKAKIKVDVAGDYLFSEHVNPLDVCWFKMTVTIGGDPRLCIESVRLEFYIQSFVFTETEVVMIENDSDGETPTPLVDGNMILARSGPTIKIRGGCAYFEYKECEIEFRWCPTGPRKCAWLKLGEKYKGQIFGLFGNFNDDEDDDYKTRDGRLILDEEERDIEIPESFRIE